VFTTAIRISPPQALHQRKKPSDQLQRGWKENYTMKRYAKRTAIIRFFTSKKMHGTRSTIGGNAQACKILILKRAGKVPVGKNGLRREGIIKMYLNPSKPSEECVYQLASNIKKFYALHTLTCFCVWISK